MTYTVREARDDELERAGALVADAYLADFGGAHDGYLGEIRATRRRAATCPILVAVDDRGVLLGSVTYVPGADNPWAETEAPDEAGFRMLGVDPAARGLGVGAALVRECLDRARAAGKGGVAITSTPFMVTAHRLYERLGFQRDPSRDFDPVPGVHLLTFVVRFDA